MKRTVIVLLAGFFFLGVAAAAGAEDPPRTLSAAGKVVDAGGKPVAGATVYLREWVFLRPTRPASDQPANDILATTTSEAQGTFAFRQVLLPKPYLDEIGRATPCPWDVVVTARGYGLAWERLSSPRGRRPLELILPPAAKVQGRLLDPERKPVAGARIQVLQVQALDQRPQATVTTADNLDLAGSRLPLVATSDADGRFVLDGLPGNIRVTLAVVDDRFIRQTVYAATTDKAQPPIAAGRGPALQGTVGARAEPVHTGNFTVTLQSGHRLRIRVVDVATGKPLAGAHISRFLGPTAFSANPPADADGRLSFGPLAPGKYMLEALPPDHSNYLGVPLLVTVPPEQREVEVTASLPLGVEVTGQVMEAETGKGLAGVVVTHQSQPGGKPENRTLAATARTGPDGRFRMAVPPGKGRLQVASDVPGYVRTEFVPSARKEIDSRSVLPVEVQAGQPLAGVKLALTRGLVATVRVLDPDGKVVSGARALGSTSDGEGRLTLTGLDLRKNRDLVITHADRQLAARVNLPAPKDEAPLHLEVKLQPAGSVVGRVLGEDHKALPRVSVQLLKSAAEAGGKSTIYNTAPVAPLATDAEGRFTLEDLVPGIYYTVAVTARGYVMAFGVPFEARPGQAHSLPDIRLPRADQTIAGVVLDPLGKPLAGVQVNGLPVRGGGVEQVVRVREGQTFTDKEGRFRLRGFPKGTVRLTAFLVPSLAGPDRTARTQATVQIEAGQQDVQIVLVGPQTRRPVEAVTGKPAPEFPVRRWLQRPGAPAERGFTREDFRDKVVLLAFLDDSKPSQRLLPRLNQLHEKLAGKGLAVVRVYELENPKEELTKLSPTVAALVAPGLVPGGYSEAFQKYGARATPGLFLIDRGGVLRQADVEADALEARLEELLKP
jgi:protocatechuate 3,4-dioxygenase beta subunit